MYDDDKLLFARLEEEVLDIAEKDVFELASAG